jgi:uncharacterized repeat protein (TIGR01451 family)
MRSGPHQLPAAGSAHGQRRNLSFAACARLVLALVFVMSIHSSSHSATRTWSGGVSTVWSNSANWVGGNRPGTTDDVIISGSCVRYPLITGSDAIVVRNVLVQSGGSITQSGGSLSVYNFDMDAGGNYTQSAGLLRLSHDWMSAGTFVSTSGTVEFAGDASPSATFALGSAQFYNFVIDDGANPRFDNRVATILVAGNLTNYNGWLDVENEVTFLFNGTGNQAIESEARRKSRTMGSVFVDKSSGTLTLLTDLFLDDDLTIVNGTVDLGENELRGQNTGTLAVQNDGVLRVGGPFPTKFRTTTLSAASTVEYYGAAQVISGSPRTPVYGSLTLSGSGTKTLDGNVSVATMLSMQGYATFAPGGFTLTYGTTATLEYRGSSAQTTGPECLPTMLTGRTVAINNPHGVTLNNSVTTGTLQMIQGTLFTGSNSVTVTVDRTGNGIIIGTITRTHAFAAGLAYAFESRFSTLTFAASGTLPGSVTMTVVLTAPATNASMEPIARYYDISQTGGSGFTCGLRLHYEDTEVVSPNSETSPPLQLWRRIAMGPDVWENRGASGSNTSDNWVEVSGQTDLGRWTLSSRTLPAVVLTLAQSESSPSPGQVVTYTITYSSGSGGPATTVLITAPVPPNTTYLTGNTMVNGVLKTDQGGDDEVTVTGSTIAVSLGTLPPGTTGTITFSVTIQ